MKKTYLQLQPSESTVTLAAAQIYAAYIAAGRVEEGTEDDWMDRSIKEAIKIAEATDRMVIAGDEVDSNETTGGIRRSNVVRGRHE